jgi:hypothetical protein
VDSLFFLPGDFTPDFYGVVELNNIGKQTWNVAVGFTSIMGG